MLRLLLPELALTKRLVIGAVILLVITAAFVLFLTYPKGIVGGTQLSVAREMDAQPGAERITLDAADLEQNCPELDLAFQKARHDGIASIESSRSADKAIDYLNDKYGQSWRGAILQWEDLDYRISAIAA